MDALADTPSTHSKHIPFLANHPEARCAGNNHHNGDKTNITREEKRLRAEAALIESAIPEQTIAARGRERLRDRAAIDAWIWLESITPAKVRKATAPELMSMVEKAVKIAGLQPVTAKEEYFKSMSDYLKQKTQQFRKAKVIDADPTPQDVVVEQK